MQHASNGQTTIPYNRGRLGCPLLPSSPLRLLLSRYLSISHLLVLIFLSSVILLLPVSTGSLSSTAATLPRRFLFLILRSLFSVFRFRLFLCGFLGTAGILFGLLGWFFSSFFVFVVLGFAAFLGFRGFFFFVIFLLWYTSGYMYTLLLDFAL